MQFGQLLPTFFLQRTCMHNECPPDHLSLTVLSLESSLGGNEWGMLGKYLGKGQVECHCVGFPQGGNYSRGIGDAWYPSKTKDYA